MEYQIGSSSAINGNSSSAPGMKMLSDDGLKRKVGFCGSGELTLRPSASKIATLSEHVLVIEKTLLKTLTHEAQTQVSIIGSVHNT